MKWLSNPYVIGGGALVLILVFVLSNKGGSDGGSALAASSLGSANSTNVALADLSTQRDIAAMAFTSEQANIAATREATGMKADLANYLGTLDYMKSNKELDLTYQIQHETIAAGVSQNVSNNTTSIREMEIAADAGIAMAPFQADLAKALAQIEANSATNIATINAQNSQTLASILAIQNGVQAGLQPGSGSNGGSFLSDIGNWISDLF